MIVTLKYEVLLPPTGSEEYNALREQWLAEEDLQPEDLTNTNERDEIAFWLVESYHGGYFSDIVTEASATTNEPQQQRRPGWSRGN